MTAPTKVRYTGSRHPRKWRIATHRAEPLRAFLAKTHNHIGKPVLTETQLAEYRAVMLTMLATRTLPQWETQSKMDARAWLFDGMRWNRPEHWLHLTARTAARTDLYATYMHKATPRMLAGLRQLNAVFALVWESLPRYTRPVIG